ncbi:MAG TPA: SDR family oxidoreductase [Saprospiraceae bacterium]|nr:SDR family oxidoreductase [Saprospiraceae bacterium]
MQEGKTQFKMEKTNKLKGKTFIITGATSGMGEATARLFSAQSAQLVLSGRSRERGEKLLAALKSSNPNVTIHYGDIAEEATNQRLVEMALESFGRLDGFLCHAGMLGLGSVTEISPQTWRQTLSTNLDAVFYLAHHALPVMQNGGAIVLNASIAATKSFPNHPAYCSSKAGLVAFGRQLALDYSPKVRVNVICPGPVDTPLIWSSAAAFPDPDQAVADAAANTLLKRLGKPEDIANLCLFLSTPESAWMTGAVVTIDGGITVK